MDGRDGYNRPVMRYLAAAGVGVIAAVATSMLWILVRFVLPVVLPFLLARTMGGGPAGVGSASAVIGSGSILLAALVGFCAGGAWMLLRR